ncbi:hypothetical protein GEMRC1_000853 [Eukaryota sp. GEM-RC1]
MEKLPSLWILGTPAPHFYDLVSSSKPVDLPAKTLLRRCKILRSTPSHVFLCLDTKETNQFSQLNRWVTELKDLHSSIPRYLSLFLGDTSTTQVLLNLRLWGINQSFGLLAVQQSLTTTLISIISNTPNLSFISSSLLIPPNTDSQDDIYQTLLMRYTPADQQDMLRRAEEFPPSEADTSNLSNNDCKMQSHQQWLSSLRDSLLPPEQITSEFFQSLLKGSK